MQVWYINLARRMDRNESMLKSLEEFEVPKHVIRRLEGKDRDIYASHKALANAAVADGFRCFESEKTRHLIHWGATWAHLSALREVANQSDAVMVIEDDKRLEVKYDEFLTWLDEIPDFNIAQVGYSRIRKECPSFSEHWVKGILANGTSCNIFKPVGARWFLDKCMSEFPKTPETVIRNFYQECPGGVYGLKETYRRQYLDQIGTVSDISTPTSYGGSIT